jgi:NADH-quinone oxidoreductase subunit K
MMTITLNHYLIVAAILLSLGILGVLFRRNALIVFMSIELMLNAGNLVLVAFSRHFGEMDGQVLAFFIIALAAAEVSIGLAIIVSLFRQKGSIDINSVSLMKG